MQEEHISIGVGLSPLVISVKTGIVGEKIALTLIEGLTYDGITWKSDDNEVPTLETNEVIFDKPGFYKPVVLSYIQHESYGITIL